MYQMKLKLNFMLNYVCTVTAWHNICVIFCAALFLMSVCLTDNDIFKIATDTHHIVYILSLLVG